MSNNDPHYIEGVSKRKRKPFPWACLSGLLAITVIVLGGVILSPYPEKVRRKLGWAKSVSPAERVVEGKPKVVYQEKEVIKEVPVRPKYYQVERGTDVAKTSMGFDFKTKMEEREGGLASAERLGDGTYEARFEISVNRPTAATKFEEVVKVNSELPKILPGLEDLVGGARVSPYFKTLYDNKFERLKMEMSRMDRLLTKHNYYDCQTMLEMRHPVSGRKVFLMQADMDVVSDGSDGDRLATMPDKIVNSTHYQPFTSYGWKKTGSVENPMIAGWQKQLAKAKEAGDTKEVKRLETGIADMKSRSFLIAEYDPFIVIPVNMIVDWENSDRPMVGDYAVVIYGGKLYPAIAGDGGPTFKVGEASLRLAKEINARSTPYQRPVSDVSVTYLIFPGSAGPKKAPNYEEWRQECLKLLSEIGGLGEGYEMHQWADLFPKEEVVPENVEVITPAE